MKKFIPATMISVIATLFISVFATAQSINTSGLKSVAHDSNFSGSGSIPNPLLLGPDVQVTGVLSVGDVRGVIIYPTGVVSGNDWNPAGLDNALIVHATLAANATITGIESSTSGNGRKITIRNFGGGIITLVHNSGSSLAANRIICPESANLPVRIGSSIDLFYDTATSFWYPQATTRYPTLTADSSFSSPGTNTLGNTTLATGTLNVTAGLTSLSGGTTATGTVNLGTVTTGTTTVKGPGVFDQTLAVTGNYTSAAGNLTLTAGQLQAGALLASSSTLQIGAASMPVTFKGVLVASNGLPTLGALCGTTPTIVGSNSAATITIGTGSPATCTMTFNGTPYTNDPVCTVTAQNGINKAYTHSTTTVVITAPTSGVIYDIVCVGR